MIRLFPPDKQNRCGGIKGVCCVKSDIEIAQACAMRPVRDIAAAVGYESQGKFTKAFKDVAQALPTEYRRQHRA